MPVQNQLHEGELLVDLYPDADNSVNIQSSRPLHVSSLLVGKSPQQVSSIIPLIYNVCATAQARASQLALHSALQIDFDPATENARDLMVQVENLREYLLRIFRDWPGLFNSEVNIQILPLITRLLPDSRAALFETVHAFSDNSILNIDIPALDKILSDCQQLIDQQVLAMPSQQWLMIDSIEDLLTWSQESSAPAALSIRYIHHRGWSGLGQSQVKALPVMDAEMLIKKLSSDVAEGFIESPTWSGQSCETSTYSRQLNHPLVSLMTNQYGNGLLSRWVARLVELALLPQQIGRFIDVLRHDNWTTTVQHPGLAQVETARGRLVHYAEISENRISRYQILAPTEWNFHPHGLIQQSLQHTLQQQPDNIKLAADCLINVIDPCVGYRLELH
jgi:hypothetical protein